MAADDLSYGSASTAIKTYERLTLGEWNLIDFEQNPTAGSEETRPEQRHLAQKQYQEDREQGIIYPQDQSTAGPQTT